MKKDETIQNYLEAIYFISLEKKNVRAIDICRYLNFSRPTVSVALKQFEEEDYIKVKDNSIELTTKGRNIAKKMSERHECIAKILMSIGVSKETAYRDSCLVEHDLSNESFNAIKKAIKKISK